MPDGVLLDTSFLITFADPTRKHHAVARQYFDYFGRTRYTDVLSTIVASEFHLGQPVTDLPLDGIDLCYHQPLGCHPLRRNCDFREHKGTPDVSRATIKDDFKLLGQAKAHQIAYLVTEDVRTLSKYCEELNARGKLPTRAIILSEGFRQIALSTPPGSTILMRHCKLLRQTHQK